MASINSTISGVSNTTYCVQDAVKMQFGKRALSIGRDCRKRYYQTGAVIVGRPGLDKGLLEMLLFRRWLVVLSKAH